MAHLAHILHFALRIGGAIGLIGAVAGGLIAFQTVDIYGEAPSGVGPATIDGAAVLQALEAATVGAVVGAGVGSAIAWFLVTCLGIRKDGLGFED